MTDGLKFILYFLIGGSILTLVTYYGSRDRGILAAFIAMFPMVTVLSIVTIYFESGSLSSLDYVKGLLILTPIWILFLFCILYLMPRKGLIFALVVSVSIYLILALYLIINV